MAQLLTVYRAENGFIVEIHTDGMKAPCAAPPIPQPQYNGKYKDVHVFKDAAGLAAFMADWGRE